MAKVNAITSVHGMPMKQMRRWKAWELETKTIEYQFTHGRFKHESANQSKACNVLMEMVW